MESEDELKSVVVRCGHCDAHRIGEVLGTYRDADENDPTSLARFIFARCPECNSPFLLVQDGDWHYNYDITSWGPSRYLHPAEPGFMDPSVPKTIADSYLEARRTLHDAGASTAAAIMCRRTIEGICGHFEARGGNLRAKLEDLKANGILDPRLHEWADYALRDLGNDAAHDVTKVVSRDDARDALEFTKAIIEYVFVFSSAFNRFKERRTQGADGAKR